MKIFNVKKVMSMVMAIVMMASLFTDALYISAYATDNEIQQIEITVDGNDEQQPQVCVLCGTAGHINLDCPNKCKEHGVDHVDVNCSRHLNCTLCGDSGHIDVNCPEKCAQHGTTHKDVDCDRYNTVCTLCGITGHTANICPSKCVQHGEEHLDKN